MRTEAPTPTPPLKGRGLSSRETSMRTDSPPLQGRGKGWGLTAARNAEIAGHARNMRCNPTEPEKRLWSALSGSQLGGYKFRRQAVIGNAIADFLCPRRGLVIEVDGQTHSHPANEARRTARLQAFGYHVVRVTNADVMHNLEGVKRHLLITLESLPDRRVQPSQGVPA